MNKEINSLDASAPSGNASNPSPENDLQQQSGSQLIDEKGEKYLREVSSPEDYPDAQDEQEMNDTIRKDKEEK